MDIKKLFSGIGVVIDDMLDNKYDNDLLKSKDDVLKEEKNEEVKEEKKAEE